MSISKKEEFQNKYYELFAKFEGYGMALEKTKRLTFLLQDMLENAPTMAQSSFFNRLEESRRICDELLGLTTIKLCLKNGEDLYFDGYDAEYPNKLIANYSLITSESETEKENKIKVTMFFENMLTYIEEFVALIMKLQTDVAVEIENLVSEVEKDNDKKVDKEISEE